LLVWRYYNPASGKKQAAKNKEKRRKYKMKIAVVCANGKAGKLIVKEALGRGLDVTAVVRAENQTEAEHVIRKDLFELTADDLRAFDVVIDAFGAWIPETLPQHSTSLKHLCDLVSQTDTRLLVVGGAGSLYVNPEHTVQVIDGADFPEMFKPLASNMGKALEELRTRNDVKWTYVSPAGDFQADGERTGKYILGGEELILNSRGESVISYADYAVAMVEEAVNGNHIQQRISVVAE
jgi:putative NADH-flavin reductase